MHKCCQALKGRYLPKRWVLAHRLNSYISHHMDNKKREPQLSFFYNNISSFLFGLSHYFLHLGNHSFHHSLNTCFQRYH